MKQATTGQADPPLGTKLVPKRGRLAVGLKNKPEDLQAYKSASQGAAALQIDFNSVAKDCSMQWIGIDICKQHLDVFARPSAVSAAPVCHDSSPGEQHAVQRAGFLMQSAGERPPWSMSARPGQAQASHRTSESLALALRVSTRF
jgi:hypothetical protein